LNLRIYLDDCAYDKALARLLRQAGCEVVTPFDAEIVGHADATHFAYAAHQGLILLTKNPRDFEELHTQLPEHPGILAVYQDNNATKDMNVSDIVQAIYNLVEARVPIANQFIPLNVWRYAREKS
jgi:predicted nuclease of predicted toxin-antitoxin system